MKYRVVDLHIKSEPPSVRRVVRLYETGRIGDGARVLDEHSKTVSGTKFVAMVSAQSPESDSKMEAEFDEQKTRDLLNPVASTTELEDSSKAGTG